MYKDNNVSLTRKGFTYYSVHGERRGFENWRKVRSLGLYIEMGFMLGSIHMFVICYIKIRVELMAARTNLLMGRDLEECCTGLTCFFFFGQIFSCVLSVSLNVT